MSSEEETENHSLFVEEESDESEGDLSISSPIDDKSKDPS